MSKSKKQTGKKVDSKEGQTKENFKRFKSPYLEQGYKIASDTEGYNPGIL